ncbi:MAG: flippase-like domain-containing protein [Thermoleophilaceae bacterium]|nr:flippase-like domain-containing protein [Thermoleophilaceae bacterium]
MVGGVAQAASIGESFRSFFDAVDQFFGSIAEVRLGPLILGLLLFGVYLTLRARASFNILRAAYPAERFRFREIWGAYFAGYGFNAVIPARGGDVVRLFLTKTSVPRSSYPAVGASFVVEAGFDVVMGVFILTFAFSQGVFPKPPDLAKLNAFDLSYLASHPRFALFLVTALGVAAMVVFALLSVRVKAFWARVRQGLTILYDRERYAREVFGVQFVGWLFRFAAFWFLLEAFNVGGSVRNVLLVLGVNAVAAAVPLTPQGAGVAQALLVKVFAGTASGATVAAYSVGQQIAIGAFAFGVGFAALVFIFRVRSFKEIMQRGREDRDAERASGGSTPAAREG